MVEVVLLYDGTLDGMFTAVYDGFVLKNKRYKETYIDQISIENQNTYEQQLFREYILVTTDSNKARKTAESIARKIGYDAYDVAIGVACNYSEDVGRILFGYLVRGFKIGRGVVNMLTDPYVQRAFELSRKTHNEAHFFLEILRFSDVRGRLYAKIEPKCNILHFICDHFADRFPGENWIIYDAVHHIVAVHPAYGGWFLTDDEDTDYDKLEELAEQDYADLWRLFVDTIAISQRINIRCQNNHLPKWYRKNMTEWK